MEIEMLFESAGCRGSFIIITIFFCFFFLFLLAWVNGMGKKLLLLLPLLRFPSLYKLLFLFATTSISLYFFLLCLYFWFSWNSFSFSFATTFHHYLFPLSLANNFIIFCNSNVCRSQDPRKSFHFPTIFPVCYFKNPKFLLFFF